MRKALTTRAKSAGTKQLRRNKLAKRSRAVNRRSSVRSVPTRAVRKMRHAQSMRDTPVKIKPAVTSSEVVTKAMDAPGLY